MDASRLLEVLNDVEQEFEGGLAKLLAAVVQQYTAARDSPTVDNGPAIQTALALVLESINKSKFHEYPPAKAGILKAIGGDTRVGLGLATELDKLLAIPGQTAAGTVTTMTALVGEVNIFRKSCTQVRVGLAALGVIPHAIPQGQFEVGILIPEGLVDHELSSLVKELGTWNKIIRGFQEVVGEEEREVTVTGLSSGSYETYIPLGLMAAHYLSLTIDKIFDWYSKVLEIQKHRLQLKQLGAPGLEVSAIQKHEKDFINEGIRTLAKDIIKAAHPKTDSHRKEELENHLTISIHQITRFVDKGGTVEVTSAPPETTKEPEPPTEAATQEEKNTYTRLLNEHAKQIERIEQQIEIIKSGSALSRLPARPEPILQLETVDDIPNEREKQPKKKGEKSS